MALPILVLAAGWIVAFGLPVLADHSARGSSPLHVLIADLSTDRDTRLAGELAAYADKPPDRLLLLEPAGDSAACPAGNPGARSLPSYCGVLSRLSARLPVKPIVIPASSGSGGSAVPGSSGYVTRLVKTLYGPNVAVTGGPLVFAVTVPGIRGDGIVRAIGAALILALGAAGLSFWLLRRILSARIAQKTDTNDRSPDRHLTTVTMPARDDAITLTGFPLLGGPSQVSRLPWGLPREPSPPGIVADSVRIGDLDLRAASLVGPSHRAQKVATSRQDAYCLGQDQAGRHLIVAVADGMSDSQYSHLGAAVAARAMVACLREALSEGIAVGELSASAVFRHAASEMVAQARRSGLPPEAVRTVALAAVIPVVPSEPGLRDVWVAALGDASAWRRHPSGWERLTGAEKSGLDANMLSEFLPFHPDSAVSAIVRLGGRDVLALVTDGVSDAFSEIHGAAAWFAERWQSPPPIGSFFLDVGYEAKTFQDDRTAVLVWCGSGTNTETIS